MLYHAAVHNFFDWREQARNFIEQNIIPEDIQWHDADAAQTSLFASATRTPTLSPRVTVSVPGKFITLARTVACHRDPQKWALLYQALWRIAQGERHLLALSTEPLVHQLLMMHKSVRRDAHKMKAFVRFRLQKIDEQEYYIAWYKPQHKTMELVANFFQERFNTMLWAIFTPDGYMAWNGERLKLSPQVIEIDEIKDDIENLWLTYYSSIFNPARIKLKAMCKEMPARYWSTMPETTLIRKMLLQAPQRVSEMLKLNNEKN